MAKKKVSELDPVTPGSLTLDDLLYVSQSDGGGDFVSKHTTVEQFVDDVNSITDIWVDTTGDLMTGPLQFLDDDALGNDPMTITPLEDGSINIASDDLNTLIYMHLSTADTTQQPTTGGVITGRLRWAQPIEEAVDTDLIDSSKSSGLISVTTAEAATLTIRKNDGTAGQDFFLGNWFEVWAESGVVTVVGETANVHLIIPEGKLAETRGDACKLKAVLVRAIVTQEGPITYDDEYWLISGDLADAA